MSVFAVQPMAWQLLTHQPFYTAYVPPKDIEAHLNYERRKFDPFPPPRPWVRYKLWPSDPTTVLPRHGLLIEGNSFNTTMQDVVPIINIADPFMVMQRDLRHQTYNINDLVDIGPSQEAPAEPDAQTTAAQAPPTRNNPIHAALLPVSIAPASNTTNTSRNRTIILPPNHIPSPHIRGWHRLPIKARTLIYKHLFTSPIPIHPAATHPLRGDTPTNSSYNLSAQILTSCRAIHAEALPYLYTLNTFECNHDLPRIASKEPYKGMCLIQKLVILTSMGKVKQAVFRAVKNLREVLIVGTWHVEGDVSGGKPWDLRSVPAAEWEGRAHTTWLRLPQDYEDLVRKYQNVGFWYAIPGLVGVEQVAVEVSAQTLLKMGLVC